MTRKRIPRNKDTQGFEYVESESILHGLRDEYSLSKEEHYILYSFYVEHSMYGDQSSKKELLWIMAGIVTKRLKMELKKHYVKSFHCMVMTILDLNRMMNWELT